MCFVSQCKVNKYNYRLQSKVSQQGTDEIKIVQKYQDWVGMFGIVWIENLSQCLDISGPHASVPPAHQDLGK